MREIKERSSEPRAKNPDMVEEQGDLPHDLVNAVGFLSGVLFLYKEGKYPEDKFREYLRGVETFDDYYRELTARYSKAEVENGREPFDASASIAVQRAVITNQEAIANFDKKVMELKAMADAEVIDEKRIEQIVREEIPSIVYGKK